MQLYFSQKYRKRYGPNTCASSGITWSRQKVCLPCSSYRNRKNKPIFATCVQEIRNHDASTSWTVTALFFSLASSSPGLLQLHSSDTPDLECASLNQGSTRLLLPRAPEVHSVEKGIVSQKRNRLSESLPEVPSQGSQRPLFPVTLRVRAFLQKRNILKIAFVGRIFRL